MKQNSPGRHPQHESICPPPFLMWPCIKTGMDRGRDITGVDPFMWKK